MRKVILFLSIIVLIFEFSACTPSKPTTDIGLMSPDRLIKKLEANRRKIKTFDGTGSLMIVSSSINAKSSFEVLIKKPDSMKVSFYGPFGIDLAQVLITPNYFQFYDIINNTLYRGKMRKDVMKQLLKIDLPFDNIIDAFAGSVNLTSKLRTEPDKYEAVDDLFRLTYKDSVNSTNEIYMVRNDNLAITENTIQTDLGRVILEGKYSLFKDFDEVPIPFEINLEDSQNKQRMKVEYKNINVNQPVEGFKIDLPNDVKVVEW